MNTETYRFNIGTFECIVISDGNFAFPAQPFFANALIEHLEQVLREHNLQPDQLLTPVLVLFIDTGQHRVLVDTGAKGFAPTTGRLMQNLQGCGIVPEDIDTVILTHAHPDHIGGCTDDDGAPAFPNARYVMSKTEWEFWMPEPDLSNWVAEEYLKQLARDFAHNNLPPIEGQLELVEHQAEVVPGIDVIAAPGHTPGHIALEISSGSEQLLCSVDTAIHPLHLEYSDWYPILDFSPKQAVTTKHQLLNRAAAEKLLVFACHFPFPGLGHVTKKDQGWEWQPIQAGN